MITNKTYLRDWQKWALPGYLSRVNQNFSELTVAYQGSGKTLYTSLCYVSSVLKNSGIKDLSIGEIADLFNNSPNKNQHFPIVFIPARSIRQTTIDTWSLLGVKLTHIKNPQLEEMSPARLISEGFNGLICLYQQAYSGGESSSSEWSANKLVQFIKRSPDVNIHGILDECHELTVYGKGKANKKASYFLLNQHLFFRLHLISGSPIKVGFKYVSDNDSPKDKYRIPFVDYSGSGDVIANTLYTQEDAIKDGVIVQTKPIIHSIAHSNIEIDGSKYSLTASDIDWFGNNFSTYAIKFSEHPDHERLHQINDAFNALYKSVDIWKHLLVYGDFWLSETKKMYSGAKGIIFAPSQESAINIHRYLSSDRSVLCLGDSNESGRINFDGCKFVKSDKIKQWLVENESSIDWIVSCQALVQGFDYPNCKVSIIVPQLQFLHLIKIAQIIGRTNRSIDGYPDLKATCITLDYKPIKELVKLSQSIKFGLCSSDVLYTNSILDMHSDEVIQISHEKTKAKEKGENIPIKDIKIHDLMMSNISRLITENGEVFYSYSPDVIGQLSEINIKSYWTYWGDIIYQNTDLTHDKTPPEDSGVYIISNAKTSEILYVGKADNLLLRISNKPRYRNLSWLTKEGAENLFVKWIICDNISDQESLSIYQLKPKYNKQHPMLPSRITRII